MRNMRDRMIFAGFASFRATGLHRLMAPWTRGRGAILMFHHVRPARADAFDPNRLLEITPQFLEGVIVLVRTRGFEIVGMDEALERLARPKAPGEKPFAVLTFDDGYWDNRDYALPILQAQNAPFTLFVTTGFADRSARLWWRELEAAIRQMDQVVLGSGTAKVKLPARTAAEKSQTFAKAYWWLRGKGEPEMLQIIASLCKQAGVDTQKLVAGACMDWDAIKTIARDPLCTIGVHTLTHSMLAKHDLAMATQEMAESRRITEAHIGKPALHFSYPVGDRTSAGEREFQLAKSLGFASAVTTRPGMVLDAHRDRLTNLPRLSINGKWQSLATVDVLLSGAPFALFNFGQPA